MKTIYHPSSYDKYLCLKPSAGMIIAMIYAVRHTLLIFLAYFPGMRGSVDSSLISHFTSPLFVVTDIPALLLLASWRFRLPSAHKMWRSIWSNGRAILLATLLIQLVTMIWREGPQLLNYSENNNGPVLIIGNVMLCIYFLFYAYSSTRVRDVFSDHPDAPMIEAEISKESGGALASHDEESSPTQNSNPIYARLATVTQALFTPEGILWFVTLIGMGIIYLPGLGNALIFDDSRTLQDVIFPGYGSVHELKPRLLSYGSFVWVRDLFGDGWWKQRLVNILLHLCVAIGLYALIRALLNVVDWPEPGKPNSELRHMVFSKGTAAGFATMLFALNPVAVYATAYLIQRSILMATLFSVLSLLFTLRAAKSKHGWLWVGGALLLYVLAVLSKEHAILLPIVALATYLIVKRPSRKLAFGAVWIAGLITAVCAAFLIYRYHGILGHTFDPRSKIFVGELSALRPGVDHEVYLLSILNEAWLFFRYGATWFFPNVEWMSIDIRPAFPLSITTFPQVLGVPLYLCVTTGSIYLMWRFSDWRRLTGLALFMPAILFATEFSTVWIQDPFVLYRSYLWAIGMPLLVAILVVRYQPRAIAIAGLVFGIIFTILGVERVQSMKTDFSVWDDAANKINIEAPPNAVGRWRPFMNRGNQFLEQGDFSAALSDYDMAINLGENSGLAQYSRALALQQLGRLDAALEAFEAASRGTGLQQYQPLVPFQEGILLYRMHRYQEAISKLDIAVAGLKDKENLIVALKTRAKCHVKLGKTRGAIVDFSRILEIEPSDRAARIGLAMALSTSGDYGSAVNQLDRLLNEKDDTDVRFARAIVFEKMGRHEAAIKEAKDAIAMKPGDPLLLGLLRKLSAAPHHP